MNLSLTKVLSLERLMRELSVGGVAAVHSAQEMEPILQSYDVLGFVQATPCSPK